MRIQCFSLSIYVGVFFLSLVQVYRVRVAMDERMGFILLYNCQDYLLSDFFKPGILNPKVVYDQQLIEYLNK